MIITFQRPRLNPTSTKDFILEARVADYMREFLEQFTNEPINFYIPDISCDINTIRAGSQPWFWVGEVIMARVNIDFDIRGNNLSIKTSVYVFPEAEPIYLVGLDPAYGDAQKDGTLELNDYFTKAGFPQEN